MADGAASPGWQRLHPLSLLFRVGSAARRLLVPALAVLLLSRGGSAEVWLAVLFLPAVFAALAHQISYRFRLGHDELVVREGIVTRNERHVPYARIQNIDLVQNLLQRWLGVAEVRLETASGEKPEAVMRVLSLRAVADMRAHIFPGGDRASEEAGSESSSPIYQASLGGLALLGLMSNRGLAAVAAGVGLLWQLEPLGYDERWAANQLSRLDPGWARIAPDAVATGLVVFVGFLFVLVVLKLLSVVWVVIRLGGFELRARGDDLSARYGLFTRVAATVPRGRIQRLIVRRGPLQRWLGYASVQVETAGRGRDTEGADVERLWLAPMIAEERLDALLTAALPATRLADPSWQPLAPGARRRVLRRSLVLAALVSAAGGVLVGPAALLLFVPGAILGWIHARASVAHAGWALLGDAAACRRGWWTRRTSIVPFGKVQVLLVTVSPFDRRLGMAALTVDTAGAGRAGQIFHLPYLADATARALEERIRAETSARVFRW